MNNERKKLNEEINRLKVLSGIMEGPSMYGAYDGQPNDDGDGDDYDDGYRDQDYYDRQEAEANRYYDDEEEEEEETLDDSNSGLKYIVTELDGLEDIQAPRTYYGTLDYVGSHLIRGIMVTPSERYYSGHTEYYYLAYNNLSKNKNGEDEPYGQYVIYTTGYKLPHRRREEIDYVYSEKPFDELSPAERHLSKIAANERWDSLKNHYEKVRIKH